MSRTLQHRRGRSVTRRRLLAAGAAGLALPTIVPARVLGGLGTTTPGDVIRFGLIGCSKMGRAKAIHMNSAPLATAAPPLPGRDALPTVRIPRRYQEGGLEFVVPPAGTTMADIDLTTQ